MGRRKNPEDLTTSPKRRGSIEAARERYQRAGLVQINVWVPAANRDALLEWCRNVRHNHLRRVGYDAAEVFTITKKDRSRWPVSEA